jgi:hypothetical protein
MVHPKRPATKGASLSLSASQGPAYGIETMAVWYSQCLPLCATGRSWKKCTRWSLPGKSIPPPKRELASQVRDITDVRDIRPLPAYPEGLLPSPDYAFPTDGDNRKWLDRQDLTPQGECLIRKASDGTEWFALALSAQSDEKLLVDDDNAPYRRITVDYWTVLVPATPGFEAQRSDVEEALHGSAPNSYRVYFAEYPREAAFEYCLKYGELSLAESQVVHAQVTLSRGGEWEYDYSWKERAEHLDVPTKALIEKLRLHWDQHSGWVDENGELAAFTLDSDKRSALFLRKTLLDKYLLDEGQVIYARQFVYRGTIGGFGGSTAPALDVNAVLVYRAGQGVSLLDEQRELFEPDPANED